MMLDEPGPLLGRTLLLLLATLADRLAVGVDLSLALQHALLLAVHGHGQASDRVLGR